jgi:hypothetical protein
MPEVETYRRQLLLRSSWDTYLCRNSGLPGPRGNLELARAVVLEGDEALFTRYAALEADQAPENTPQVFLAFCGVLGYGRLLAEGNTAWLESLRALANDPRWRIREAVSMALQSWGDADTPSLLRAMRVWSDGTLLEQRASVAALCEPRLLKGKRTVNSVLVILDRLTRHIAQANDRRTEPFRVLRQTLGYAWSVALAADLEGGRERFERWLDSNDSDVRWILKQNLDKQRLQRVDPGWVAGCKRQLGQA